MIKSSGRPNTEFSILLPQLWSKKHKFLQIYSVDHYLILKERWKELFYARWKKLNNFAALVLVSLFSLPIDIAEAEEWFLELLESAWDLFNRSLIWPSSSCSMSTCHCSNCWDNSTFCWMASISCELTCMLATLSLAKSTSAEFLR